VLFDAQSEQLDVVTVKATGSNIHVYLVGLAWLPYYQGESGLTPAWDDRTA